MDNLLELFCIVDDFSQEFFPEFEKSQLELDIKQRKRAIIESVNNQLKILVKLNIQDIEVLIISW